MYFIIAEHKCVVDLRKDRMKVAFGSEKQVEVFSEKQVERMLFYIQNEDKVIKRDRIIILLLMYTSVRVSELCDIRVRNIDFLTGHLRVYGKGGKVREVPLKPEVVEAIKEYLAERTVSQFSDSEHLILGQIGALKRDAINTLLEKYTKELELCKAGNDRHEVAKILGYKDYKGLQAYMQRHQYTWNDSIQNYQELREYQKQVKTERVLRQFEEGATSKPTRIISMFSKKLEARDIAKKLGYESHKAMAAYMKSRGYVWNAEIGNYERDTSITVDEDRSDEAESTIIESNELTLIGGQVKHPPLAVDGCFLLFLYQGQRKGTFWARFKREIPSFKLSLGRVGKV